MVNWIATKLIDRVFHPLKSFGLTKINLLLIPKEWDVLRNFSQNIQ